MKLENRMARWQFAFPLRLRLAFMFVGMLTLGVIVGAMDTRSARAAAAQTYIVQVGAADISNTALLQFAPGSLKVHRGDTVTWLINGFHNVHVGAVQPADLIIAPE